LVSTDSPDVGVGESSQGSDLIVLEKTQTTSQRVFNPLDILGKKKEVILYGIPICDDLRGLGIHKFPIVIHVIVTVIPEKMPLLDNPPQGSLRVILVFTPEAIQMKPIDEKCGLNSRGLEHIKNIERGINGSVIEGQVNRRGFSGIPRTAIRRVRDDRNQ
jgi:hypothetical protein